MRVRVRLLFFEDFDKNTVYLGIRIGRWTGKPPMPFPQLWWAIIRFLRHHMVFARRTRSDEVNEVLRMRKALAAHQAVTEALIHLREVEAQVKGEEWTAPEEEPPELVAWCAAMNEATKALEDALRAALRVM